MSFLFSHCCSSRNEGRIIALFLNCDFDHKDRKDFREAVFGPALLVVGEAFKVWLIAGQQTHAESRHFVDVP